MSAFPATSFRAQAADEWRGPFPLPEGIETYYRVLGPLDLTIESYGNPFHLPGLSSLWDHQVGYRFHGNRRERLSEWEDDWLVVGDQGSDPFIFSRETQEILFAEHGTGRWAPQGMFSSLPEMAATLLLLGETCREAGKGLMDEGSVIRPEYRRQIVAKVAPILGSSASVESLLLVLGWG